MCTPTNVTVASLNIFEHHSVCSCYERIYHANVLKAHASSELQRRCMYSV